MIFHNQPLYGAISKREILIIEDNPDDQSLILHALNQANIQNPLVFMRDGWEALQHLAMKYGIPREFPCLVILDLALPSLNGLKLLRQLRGNPKTRRIPIIVLTGSIEARDLYDSYYYGANSYIAKDGDPATFFDKIQCLCHYWLDVCQLPVS
jgi:two-component system response regulator